MPGNKLLWGKTCRVEMSIGGRHIWVDIFHIYRSDRNGDRVGNECVVLSYE